MCQAAAEYSLVRSGEFKGAMLIGLDMVGNTCLPWVFLPSCPSALGVSSFCWPSLAWARLVGMYVGMIPFSLAFLDWAWLLPLP